MSDPGEFNPADLPDFPETDESGDVDMSLLDYNLSLTPAERIRQHDQFRAFLRIVRQAGIDYYGFDPRPSDEAE